MGVIYWNFLYKFFLYLYEDLLGENVFKNERAIIEIGGDKEYYVEKNKIECRIWDLVKLLDW